LFYGSGANEQVTFETVADFASVFGLALNYQLVPLDIVPEIKRAEPAPEQSDLFQELTVEDRSMLGNWRGNNGLL
jgi:hypothetical protein